jgi:hypothetical protein
VPGASRPETKRKVTAGNAHREIKRKVTAGNGHREIKRKVTAAYGAGKRKRKKEIIRKETGTMKIIDAHLHLFKPEDYAPEKSDGAEGKISAGPLTELYEKLGITAGIVMGNQALTEDAYSFPGAFRYCIGIGDFEGSLHPDAKTIAMMEDHLGRRACTGIKIYIGYSPVYPADSCLKPYYKLARKYHKPVAFHTGMTAGSMGNLKYSHPLTIDEVASEFPDVQFVLCHFGNPFLEEAAAVMEKNPNVAADLSGLLDGKVDLDRYFEYQSGYVQMLRSWMRYVEDDSRFMFGTDYPGADIENYVEFISRLVDKESAEKIFFDNANRIYDLGL